MTDRPPFRVALISMPWAIFNRPSIQLGALKSYLETNGNIKVATFHPYLETAKRIGIESYRTISKDSWAGETLYSPLLFPEKQAQAKKLFQRCCPTLVKDGKDFESLSLVIEQSLTQWVASLPLESFDLVGFSICFSQLFSTLAAAERIKKSKKNLPIVIGGSSCTSQIGPSLLDHFKQIDYCVSGEGERALLELCHYLTGQRKELPPGVYCRREKKTLSENQDCLRDISTLPTPDYSHYFRELQHFFPGKPFQPVLPFEFSRGCWWNKCTFCNLNTQWNGYRWKNAPKVLGEINELSDKHQCLDFTFTDNALPPKEAETLFQHLAQEQRDVKLFAEIRAVTSPEQLKLYRRGGLDHVQVGIEALSTSLLKRLNKGTTSIENIAAMKHCSELGIKLEGNLITEFPGSTAQEVQETLNNLDFVLPFHPLSGASFFLGMGSPIDQQPANFGISGITNHKNYSYLLPNELFKNLNLLVKSYRGGRQKQQQLWKPVKEKLAAWQKYHEKRGEKKLPPLYYRDGKTFLILRHEQPNGETLIHRLQGLSRKLYLFCTSIRSIGEIREHFPQLPEKTILNFFEDLSKKRLLFYEDEKVISLAIHDSTHSHP